MLPKLVVAIIMTLVCFSLSWAGPGKSASEIDAYIARYLGSLNYISIFKQGINSVLIKQGDNDSFLRELLNIPDDKLLSAIIPILRQHLSLDGARAISDYYSSDSGRAITRQQSADIWNSSPKIHLTSKQLAEYDQFIQSKAGQEALRLDVFMKSSEFDELMETELIRIVKNMRQNKNKAHGSNQKNAPDQEPVR